MKGLSQDSNLFGQVFVVESTFGDNQVRAKLEGSETVMVLQPSYIELFDGSSPVDPSACHGQAMGPSPAWLQDGDKDAAAETQPEKTVLDGNGNVLQVGSLVQLRGRSNYDGKVLTVESTDVGDGRVRVTLQLADNAVSRMAFDPAHLELVAVQANA